MDMDTYPCYGLELVEEADIHLVKEGVDAYHHLVLRSINLRLMVEAGKIKKHT